MGNIAGYELNKIYNEDCLAAMRKMPDKCFELAIVDPPYGGGCSAAVGGRFARYEHAQQDMNTHKWLKSKRSRFGGIFDKYEIKANEIKCSRNGGNWGKNYENKANHWDIAPPQEYFEELFRVSKNQIIWGGNYFNLPPTRCFLIWRKLTISEKFTMAMCEYAWTSFNDNAKFIEIAPQDSSRFHPTQKPVKLYSWILNNYAKPGDKILSTHGGSCPEAIACHDLGFEYLIFEIDKHYFEKAVERVEKHKSQVNIFEKQEIAQSYKTINFLDN